jgi:hypothetical protein
MPGSLGRKKSRVTELDVIYDLEGNLVPSRDGKNDARDLMMEFLSVAAEEFVKSPNAIEMETKSKVASRFALYYTANRQQGVLHLVSRNTIPPSSCREENGSTRC